jgi:hypothetical protein
VGEAKLRAHAKTGKMPAMASDDIVPGDIVRVAVRGRVFHALVKGTVLRGFRVEPIERGVADRTVKLKDVVDHWSHRGRPEENGPPDKAQASFDHLLDR